MTTYNTIVNGDIDPESPITTTLMTYMRDNPIAITEGASGAPQNQTASYADDSVLISSKVDLSIGSTGSQVITALGNWVIPEGVYNITAATVGVLDLQIQVAATWWGVEQVGGMVWSDGANMRIYNNHATVTYTAYWQKMA